LRSDIEAYAAGEPFPTRQENELRHLYVDARELSRLVGLTPIALTPRPKPTFPPHSGRLSTTRYWLRSDVDRWIAANRGLVSKRLRQQSQRPREDVELKKLITLFDIEALFNLDPRTAGRLIAERGFPDPIAHIGHTAIWMRSQVDAYLTGQSPNEPAIDADEVVGSRELSEMSGLPLTSVRSLRGVPPPAGKAGRKTYWWRRDIEKWLAARGEG
jgi:predicted DNA-binding transcriptional regulator AlpA